MEAFAEGFDVVSGGGDRLLPISKSPFRMIIDHHEFDEGWAGSTFTVLPRPRQVFRDFEEVGREEHFAVCICI